jgi:DNA-binding transcriptional LysR family regulator
MSQSPSIDSLQCFVEAARLLNFRAAARAVALSPAALGQRIRQLEDNLGTQLFFRTTRTVVLTEAGLRLLPQAEKALAAVRDCIAASTGRLGHVEFDLVLGTRHELGLSWVVPLLPRLQKDHPGLTIHLYFGSGPDLVLRVRSLAIDCAVTSTVLTDPKLDFIRLHEERYAFVAAPRLLARHSLSNVGDAHVHCLIDANDELPLFRYWRDAAGGVDSMQFGRVRRMGTIAAIRELVLRGEGVAVLPLYFVAADVKAKRLRQVFPKVKPKSDYFRLVFRADDPRRSYFQSLAKTMLVVPLS